MYSFRDTIDKQYTQGLPSEALNINGKYIENEIEGYQTLKVSGRELLDTELMYKWEKVMEIITRVNACQRGKLR